MIHTRSSRGFYSSTCYCNTARNEYPSCLIKNGTHATTRFRKRGRPLLDLTRSVLIVVSTRLWLESRLFEVPEAFGNEHGRCNSDSPRRMSCVEPIPYPRFKQGIYRCCRFCGLLADVITTQRQEADGYVSIVQWSLLLKGGQFLMVCHAQDELSFHSRMNISRGTGKYSINCINFTF
jgi:hypothetical protein